MPADDDRAGPGAGMRVIGIAGDDRVGTLLRTHATAYDLCATGRRVLVAATRPLSAGRGRPRPGVQELLRALPLVDPPMRRRLLQAAIVPGDAGAPDLLPAGAAPLATADAAAIELLLDCLREHDLDDVLVPVDTQGDPWARHVDGVLGVWLPAAAARPRTPSTVRRSGGR